MIRSRPRPAARYGAAFAAAVMVLTGCSSGVPVPRDTSAVGASGSAPSPDPLTWSACGKNLECATIKVPQEYTEPDGAQIPLALMRHRATDAGNRIGSLVFNPGGPGVPATEALRNLPKTAGTPGTFSPAVLARFDIIAMDPRGVGGSQAVRCLTDEQRADAAETAFDPAVPGGKPLPRLLTDAAAFTDGCVEHQSKGFLASLSTDNVARDIDRVRAALGEDRITYYGLSYGTVVGPMYATLFPHRVRQMVLDAPVDTNQWFGDSLPLQHDVALASERTLNAWFETCRTEGTAVCPFGAGDPQAAFDALIDRLEAKPLRIAPVKGVTPGGRLDGAMALEATRALAGDQNTWPLLTSALLAAQDGNGAPLYTLWSSVTVSPFPVPTAMFETHTAVRCADWRTPTGIAAHKAAARKAVTEARRVGTRAAYSTLNCARWPAPNKDRVTKPLTGAGAPPALVVAGRLDPVTPHHWAETMTRTLDSAVLLTREGVGHGSYGTNRCVDSAVDAALIHGTHPADGTVCKTDKPATTRPLVFPDR
ncbi:alpha/beta hydrolase [Streptomyces rubrolavendulae]|uniref:Carboxylesterase A n=1 Tax=Streptomyces rubrolavendulae TaxID=285473 RepID=A0A1D8G7T5_9ACTN|nr:alpha/beta hydrolase [Streptomyces rubrolavendulae]AOT61515.1 Carboxylesterase A precursor [Streptomyces rubrolavendulae]